MTYEYIATRRNSSDNAVTNNRAKVTLDHWFLTLLEVLNPTSLISAITEPFVIVALQNIANI